MASSASAPGWESGAVWATVQERSGRKWQKSGRNHSPMVRASAMIGSNAKGSGGSSLFKQARERT
jgi:hypothetical protein